jgi:hypothetical protein
MAMDGGRQSSEVPSSLGADSVDRVMVLDRVGPSGMRRQIAVRSAGCRLEAAVRGKQQVSEQVQQVQQVGARVRARIRGGFTEDAVLREGLWSSEPDAVQCVRAGVRASTDDVVCELKGSARC